MPFVSTFEEVFRDETIKRGMVESEGRGKARGKAEGLAEGQRQGLLDAVQRLLKKKFAEEALTLTAAVDALNDADSLRAVLDAIPDATSIAEVRAVLEKRK